VNTKNLRKAGGAWLVVALLSATLIACGTLEVSVERTPTPDHAATATVAALATENARLATQVATMAVPTPTPPPSLGKLAYVQGGDIWVKTLPDGDPQRLTTDGRNREPRWSPSGQWLAFRKGDHQVWLISADGNDARSLNEDATVGSFAWAPVSDRLAYVANGEMRAIDADGTDPATLVPPSLPDRDPGQVGHIVWAPDGSCIAYEWVEKPPDQPLTYEGLWKVSSDGRQRTELYASGAPEKGVALLAGWSLDGQHILFWQGDILSASLLSDGPALYSLPADGGEPTKLVDSVLVHDDFLAPAPQGDRWAVTAGSYRATWTNKRVAVVEARGGELIWLTDEGVAAFSPAWSPDGVHLAYAAMPDRGDLVGGEDARLGMMERHIWMINAQGEPQPQQLTEDPAYRDERPLWSADGSHLLFARMAAEGPASLWLIPAGGGDPRQVMDDLTPLPGPASGWFGYYGHVEWDQLFDWWRGPARPIEGVTVPTLGTDVVIDCADIYPGLPGCLRAEPLVSGRLAFVTERLPFDRTTVLDLEHGDAWTLSPVTLLEWSPSGNHLIAGRYNVYRYDGAAMNSFHNRPISFWAPLDALPGAHDWLAMHTADGALLAAPFPEGETRQVLPPDGLGNDGRGTVRWSLDGWLAWSLNADQLAEAGQFEQMLYVRPAEGDAEVTAWRLSDDIREAYYQIVDWVPGTRLILAARGMLAVSLWSWGVPLVTINADTGEITDLGAAMLLTPEAYAWHPAQPGLLALAEGGSRYLFETGRLALLDVTTGELRTLTSPDVAALEPAWSPDETLLAYAAVPAPPDAEGNGTTLEHTLDGRAIYVVNPQNGETHQLTDPGDAIDGWPQWSADGTRLLYTRQHDGYTDVRVVSLDGSSDELLVTGLPDPTCYYGGCGWRQMVAYYSGP
jgi:Tol biopolymer transport system component